VTPYDETVSGRPSRGKAAIAAQAWSAVLDLAMGQRNRFFAILQDAGLTPGDLRALSVLDADAPRPMGSLAQACRCDASNVTWMVDRLEERGLVERRSVPTDRRVKAIALTELGVETRARVLERLREPPADLLLLDRTTLEQLREALNKLPLSLRSPDSPQTILSGPTKLSRPPAGAA
jgi:DNA-binding MarR family transcriptional regulator